MTLGKIHLTTLEKVKDTGPISDGLHPAINGLRDAGFVNTTEDGYTISKKGEAALLVYGDENLSSKHRSVLMRLYSHHKDGRMFTFAQLGPLEEADDLITLGLIFIEGDHVHLTEDGIAFWESATEAYAYKDQANSDWTKPKKKKAKSPSPPVGRDLGRGKTNADNADSQPPPDEIAKLKEQLMTASGNLISALDEIEQRDTEITHLQEKVEELQQSLHQSGQVYEGAVKDLNSREQEVYELRNRVRELEKGQRTTHDCTTCLTSEVLDRLASRNPVVAELRENVRQQRDILNKLNI